MGIEKKREGSLMSTIEEGVKILDGGTRLITYRCEFIGTNTLVAEAGTTGYKGGDAGHGGHTYFRIQDLGDTDMSIRNLTGSYKGNGFEVVLRGDSELETIIRALRFIAEVLESKASYLLDLRSNC